jgi:ATP-dependent Clp endopeptidase proteolytic subunit ClpP
VVADGAPSVPRGLADDVASRLLDRRVVLLSGDVDATRVSLLAAELMTLDALGDGHIELRLGTCAGTLEASLALIDVIGVLGVEVRTSVLGAVEGGPIGVLVAGERRSITPHGRLRLREPDSVASGTARDLERTLAERAAVREAFFSHVARRVGRPVADVGAEWERASSLEAIDAIALGYVDQVLERSAP